MIVVATQTASGHDVHNRLPLISGVGATPTYKHSSGYNCSYVVVSQFLP